MNPSSLLLPVRRLMRLVDDARGVAAIEFALIAPVLVLFFYGSFEVSMMLQSDRRVSNTAATMSDLVSRSPTIDATEVQNVFRSAELTMTPHDTSTIRLRITSVDIDPDTGLPRVDWSRANANWSPRADGSTLSVPAGMIPPNGSVILAEVEYDYVSKTGFLFQATRTMGEEHWMRPRRTDYVTMN